MTRRGPKPLSKQLRSLYRWHRWLGIISALFVIWLAFSGILLQHSHQLKLDQLGAEWHWLQSHYGIQPQPPQTGLRLEQHWLSHVDGHLYLNEQLIGQGTPPVGFTRLGLLWAAASRESLWLLNDKAEVLDQLQGLDLPGRITAVASESGNLLLATERGLFSADPLAANWPDWQPATRSIEVQYHSSELPPELTRKLVEQARYQALNWERLILDAHSGRLFGHMGVWLMDAMAVIFVLLGITGLWLWLRFQRSRRRRLRRLHSRHDD